ncbi:hypothetical protein MPSEU_000143000 [Mayamaea pseudoterrestris]|nr:hypothetical protein MPSEU_000143000 [Mayamaea pseudoterrestris]
MTKQAQRGVYHSFFQSIMRSFLHSLLATLLLLHSLAHETGDLTTCQCSLTTPAANEDGCAVYGYHLGHLMAWEHVDFRCLRDLNVSTEDEISVDQVSSMCPYANGTDADVTSIVSAFRTDTPIGNFLKSSYDEYFVLNNETNNYEWRDTIQSENNAQPVDCVSDESFCYQELAIYLSQSDSAQEEVEFICTQVLQMYYEYALNKQSQVRQVLCASVATGGVNSSSECYDLYEQIYAHADADGNVDCTGIGNGPGNNTLPPVCEGPVVDDGDEHDDAHGGDGGGEASSGSFVSVGVALLYALISSLVMY